MRGRIMLPFEVEFQFLVLNDNVRMVLTAVLTGVFLYYGWTKSSEDSTWAGRRFARFISYGFLIWITLSILIPVMIMGAIYPSLLIELSLYVLNLSMIGIVLVIAIIVIVQVIHYKGYLQSKE
jgi:hypothetical protein